MPHPWPKDLHWNHDLLWHYLADGKGGALGTNAQSRWLWYQYLQHAGKSGKRVYNERRFVYELLVDRPAETHATTTCTGYSRRPTRYGRMPIDPGLPGHFRMCENNSLLPWNQNNPALLRTQKGGLVCGSAVLAFFSRYMGYKEGKFISTVPPSSLDITRSEKFIDDICTMIIERLSKNVPVRIGLGHDKVSHYVGIVAVAKTNTREFLFVEPWGGNHRGTSEVTYQGRKTAFLGRVVYDARKVRLWDVDYGYVLSAELS